MRLWEVRYFDPARCCNHPPGPPCLFASSPPFCCYGAPARAPQSLWWSHLFSRGWSRCFLASVFFSSPSPPPYLFHAHSLSSVGSNVPGVIPAIWCSGFQLRFPPPEVKFSILPMLTTGMCFRESLRTPRKRWALSFFLLFAFDFCPSCVAVGVFSFFPRF